MCFVICFLTAFFYAMSYRYQRRFSIFSHACTPIRSFKFFQNRVAPIFKNSSSSSPIIWTAFHISELEIITPQSTRIFNTLQARICQNLSVACGFNFVNTFAVNGCCIITLRSVFVQSIWSVGLSLSVYILWTLDITYTVWSVQI